MLHQVGVGVLGPVFRTYEPDRDRLVAVKVFRLDITPESAQSLADELARGAEAGLFHPAIVEPLAAGVEGSVAYRAEEYVAAETLDVALRHLAPAPIDKVVPIVLQLAGAIDFARQAGVGHGALHPRDIFISPEDTRVTGFGVAEALERVGLRAPVRRPYSAPERVAGAPWSTPADVFSLAAVAYELLTGRRPAGTGDQIGAIAGDGTGALHAVLARAMADAPEDRFASATGFANALDAAARGEYVAAAFPAPRLDAGMREDAGLPVDEIAAPVAAGELDEPIHHRSFTLDPAEFDPMTLAAPDEEALPVGRDDDEDREGDEEEGEEEHLRGEAPAVIGSLFDAGPAVDPDVRQGEMERFADDFASASRETPRILAADDRLDETDPPAAPPAYDRSDVPPPFVGAVPVRSGVSRGAVAGLVALALVIGFAAGHMIGSRGAADPAQGTTSQPSADAGAPASGPGAAPRSFSEQAVGEQKGVAPPVPVEEPPLPVSDATPAPSAPEVTSGRLTVRSTPSGAGVTVDGTWRGRTPLTLDKLGLRSYAVRVVQPGFRVASDQVTLSQDAPSRSLSFTLERDPAAAPAARGAGPAAPPASAQPQASTGTIYVDSRPRGARILLDGRPVGTTPARIPDVAAGSRTISLQLDNHRPWTASTRVVAGQESRVTGSLEPIR